jgi:serine/threonine protein kinase
VCARAPTPINSSPCRPRLSLPGCESRTLPSPSPDATSRAEFDILGPLGVGGFGRVEHVRRKHDGAEFALKQVPLPRSSNLMPELAAVAAREVMNEPRLHMLLGQHPNLVRCHGYWLERLETTYARLSRSVALSTSGAGQSGFLVRKVDRVSSAESCPGVKAPRLWLGAETADGTRIARSDRDAPKVAAATPARLRWLQRHGVLGRADSFTEDCSVSEWSVASSCAPLSPMSSTGTTAAAATSSETIRPRGKWTLCILLELCGCTPLSRWLREHSPTVVRAEQIFVQVRAQAVFSCDSSVLPSHCARPEC